ncbi:MAG TPA: hypothetical protein VHB79_20995 [Polyangiaceae bacterium]|nr:hypothetical protein [Polyangiaceae bacterium]
MLQRFLLPTSLAALAAACSVLIDVDAKQCEVDADCAKLTGAPAGAVCVQSLCVGPDGDVASAGAAGMSGDPLECATRGTSKEDTVKYSFAPIFAPGGEPDNPQPFSIKACEQLDLTCEHPVFGPIDVNVDEPQDFIVPTGFNGYFEITNPDTLGGLMFVGRPVVQDTIGWNITMPTPQLVVTLSAVTGEDVDPMKGLILTVARDCAGNPLANVTVHNTKGGLGYYFVNFLPDTNLTKTGPQGAAGWANVPITTTILSGTHDSGKNFGPVSIRTRPGFMSFAELWPAP